jgi:hypothetical protein
VVISRRLALAYIATLASFAVVPTSVGPFGPLHLALLVLPPVLFGWFVAGRSALIVPMGLWLLAIAGFAMLSTPTDDSRMTTFNFLLVFYLPLVVASFGVGRLIRRFAYTDDGR